MVCADLRRQRSGACNTLRQHQMRVQAPRGNTESERERAQGRTSVSPAAPWCMDSKKAVTAPSALNCATASRAAARAPPRPPPPPLRGTPSDTCRTPLTSSALLTCQAGGEGRRKRAQRTRQLKRGAARRRTHPPAPTTARQRAKQDDRCRCCRCSANVHATGPVPPACRKRVRAPAHATTHQLERGGELREDEALLVGRRALEQQHAAQQPLDLAHP